MLYRGSMSVRFALLPLLLLCAAGPAAAQSVQSLGEFRDWSAYTAAEGTGMVCFAMSKPTDVSPPVDGYTQAYLYLTNRPAEGVNNEINLVAGFDFAPDQPATLTISGKSFALFTQKDAAWLLEPSQNDDLAGAMRAGSSLTIEGTTDKGILVTQTFSLSGATAASRALGGC
jgi:hypothetical protein